MQLPTSVLPFDPGLASTATAAPTLSGLAGEPLVADFSALLTAETPLAGKPAPAPVAFNAAPVPALPAGCFETPAEATDLAPSDASILPMAAELSASAEVATEDDEAEVEAPRFSRSRIARANTLSDDPLAQQNAVAHWLAANGTPNETPPTPSFSPLSSNAIEPAASESVVESDETVSASPGKNAAPAAAGKRPAANTPTFAPPPPLAPWEATPAEPPALAAESVPLRVAADAVDVATTSLQPSPATRTIPSPVAPAAQPMAAAEPAAPVTLPGSGEHVSQPLSAKSADATRPEGFSNDAIPSAATTAQPVDRPAHADATESMPATVAASIPARVTTAERAPVANLTADAPSFSSDEGSSRPASIAAQPASEAVPTHAPSDRGGPRFAFDGAGEGSPAMTAPTTSAGSGPAGASVHATSPGANLAAATSVSTSVGLTAGTTPVLTAPSALSARPAPRRISFSADAVARAPANSDEAKIAATTGVSASAPVYSEATPEIKSLTAKQHVVKQRSTPLGINVAKTEDLMPASSPTAPLPPTLPESVGVAPVAATFDVSAAHRAVERTPGEFAAELPAAARRAVDSALAIAEHLAADGQRGVNLQFTVSGVDLGVRVEMRGDAVHTTFRTDSSELRAALAVEWQAVTGASGAERPQRLAEPVFTASAAGTSTQADAGGAQQRESGSRQAPMFANEFAGTRFLSRNAAPLTSSVEPPAPRLSSLSSPGRLHAFA